MIQKINQSTSKWKIVCGHHTWRSVGGHGNGDTTMENFMTKLYKKAPFDIYFCGHDHCKSLIEIDISGHKLPVIVIGAGGKSYRKDLLYLENITKDSELLYYSPNLGTCLLKENKNQLTCEFYNHKNKLEYLYHLK